MEPGQPFHGCSPPYCQRLHLVCKKGCCSTIAAAAVSSFTLNFGDKTNCIKDLQQSTGNGQWFTIDGRRLNGKPTAKGLYINKGKAVVIK